MKKLYMILSFLLWGQVLLLQAQTTEEQIAIPLSKPAEPGSLKVSILYGNLKVQGYDGEEVVIRMQVPQNKVEVSNAPNGLRKISNNSIGLEAREENNRVSIQTNAHNRQADMEVLVPRRFSLNLQTVNGQQLEVREVNGEIVIENVNGGILVEDVEGSAILNTVNGDIQVRFLKITPNVPMSFTNLNGKVEVSLPAGARFSTKAKTEHGSLYTDFDIKLRAQQERVQSSSKQGVYRMNIENWVQGDVNGGGPEFLFKSLNGDIVIKKINR